MITINLNCVSIISATILSMIIYEDYYCKKYKTKSVFDNIRENERITNLINKYI